MQYFTATDDFTKMAYLDGSLSTTWTSSDTGTTWVSAGSVLGKGTNGIPLLSPDGSILYSLPSGQTIPGLSSTNMGATWQILNIPPASYAGHFCNWNGTKIISWCNYPSPTPKVNITGGTFNAPVYARSYDSSCSITGGTFNDLVSLTNRQGHNIAGSPTFNSTLTALCLSALGGTFNSTVTILNQSTVLFVTGGTFNDLINFNNGGFNNVSIIGGTYKPPATVTFTLSAGQYYSTGWVKDIGFGVLGSFAPIYTYTGLPNTLGAGLL